MQKKKDNLFDKIVKKDYNNELETILEGKDFDESVKNLLLGILYKVETAYKDYTTIKRDVETKEEYIKNIIDIIKDKCDDIKIIKPNSEESKILENRTFIINKDKKEIICYPIERKLLYAISKISKENKIIKEKYFLICETLSNTLNIGNNINTVEPLRDFNGWSWTTIPREIENLKYNIIYQNLRILVGNEFLNNWINNNEFLIDYLEVFENKLEEKYGKENSTTFIEELKEFSILMDLRFNKEMRDKIQELDKNVTEDLEKLNDKKTFIVDIAKEKKYLEEKIDKIDKIINDKELLNEEYIKRNEKLPLDKKIFSMRILSEIMFKEKEELINKIEELNDLLNPRKYINKKKQLEKKQQYLKLINVEDIDYEIEKIVINMQKRFLECFNIKIQRAETRQEIIDLIYELRYYLMLPLNFDENIGENIDLEESINKIKKLLIEKALEYKMINELSSDAEFNFNVLKHIFNIRIISLEELNIKIIKDKDKIYMQIFDENIFEQKFEICKKEDLKIKDLNIKSNKNVKLFV